jgi:hypothetical protein
MNYQNKDVYDGEWLNDMCNGYGNMEFKNGDIYLGSYIDNQ